MPSSVLDHDRRILQVINEQIHRTRTLVYSRQPCQAGSLIGQWPSASTTSQGTRVSRLLLLLMDRSG